MEDRVHGIRLCFEASGLIVSVAHVLGVVDEDHGSLEWHLVVKPMVVVRGVKGRVSEDEVVVVL